MSCPRCNSKYENKINHDEFNFKCTDCGFYFNKDEEYENWYYSKERLCLTELPEDFYCSNCASNNIKKVPLSLYHYECDDCGYPFKTHVKYKIINRI